MRWFTFESPSPFNGVLLRRPLFIMPQPPPDGTHIGLFHLRDDEIKTIKITVKNSLCLDSNTFGSYNTASGEGALSRNTGDGNSIPAGSYNTASGAGALAFNTTGRYNTAIGFQALISNTTGTRNIAIGSDASPLLDIGDNNIIIGSHPAGPGFLNTVIIGDGVTPESRVHLWHFWPKNRKQQCRKRSDRPKWAT
jgi:hypothetical protein